MSKIRRQRVESTNDREQLQFLNRFPEQLTYELIRPAVLFGHSAAARALETGTPQRTLYRLAARFETGDMASRFAPACERHQRLPAETCEALWTLKAEYPAFRPNELAITS